MLAELREWAGWLCVCVCVCVCVCARGQARGQGSGQRQGGGPARRRPGTVKPQTEFFSANFANDTAMAQDALTLTPCLLVGRAQVRVKTWPHRATASTMTQPKLVPSTIRHPPSASIAPPAAPPAAPLPITPACRPLTRAIRGEPEHNHCSAAVTSGQRGGSHARNRGNQSRGQHGQGWRCACVRACLHRHHHHHHHHHQHHHHIGSVCSSSSIRRCRAAAAASTAPHKDDATNCVGHSCLDTPVSGLTASAVLRVPWEQLVGQAGAPHAHTWRAGRVKPSAKPAQRFDHQRRRNQRPGIRRRHGQSLPRATNFLPARLLHATAGLASASASASAACACACAVTFC
ncbi:hypothetical protein COCMIDRAFT_21498 [Bipolaris oryzae ATCC 44560]|uniref:Secreted protein n=1 Tax=Bipolaris oryzae ATCC 44560 TaxID=930090 RepID=W6ZGW8_COCMI|nr:uncharacterized protein COCMIDRAFT_21498 [Bipolaris oryzae ATCC 44560]EUC51112.1 hypothetical protein COCMIDRAFT_21498 [Bipolaris oryzae ATCC 44560]